VHRAVNVHYRPDKPQACVLVCERLLKLGLCTGGGANSQLVITPVYNIYEVVGLVKHTGSPRRFGGAVKGARRAFIEDP